MSECFDRFFQLIRNVSALFACLKVNNSLASLSTRSPKEESLTEMAQARRPNVECKGDIEYAEEGEHEVVPDAGGDAHDLGEGEVTAHRRE